MHEASLHTYNSWITLTYDKKHLPLDRSLNVGDFQKFMKRLRKRTGCPIRFYHCGEYGEINWRPHYHACIFGFEFPDKTKWRTNKHGDQAYRSELLEDAWKLGASEIGALTEQSAAYTARYIMKKQNGEAADMAYFDYFTGSIRQSPYTTMSTRPGIGRGWIDKYISEVYPRDEVIVNGHQARPPKYYDAQYKELDPDGYEKMKLKREEAGRDHADDNTPERLAIKEEYLKAQTSTLSREL